jgi:hypothetical protein
MEKRQKVAYKTLNRKLKTDYTNPTKSGGELYKWHQKLGMNSISGTKNWGVPLVEFTPFLVPLIEFTPVIGATCRVHPQFLVPLVEFNPSFWCHL